MNAARLERAVLPLFAGTLFLSSFLLFAVQPMFVRAALPLLGGAPAVWNTAMVFFQAALLGGYLYAHLSSRALTLGRQAALHGAVLALGLISLPIGVARGWTPPLDAQTAWLLGLLAASVGLPFFALAASTPLLQRWFSHSAHADAADPYFLSASSNTGSLLALVSYPLLVERSLTLSTQGWAWTAGYLLLALGIGACALVLRRTGASTAPEVTAAVLEPLPRFRRARWVLLSATPAALLVGVTLHISTDIAAVPFLWVLPLGLYLLSFVVAFARTNFPGGAALPWVQAVVCALLIGLFEVRHLGVLLVLHLSGFFLCALVCHLQLAALRPGPTRLTEFYLSQSLGGVIGGSAAALLAPLVFSGVYEYPLALLLALALRPAAAAKAPPAVEVKKQKKSKKQKRDARSSGFAREERGWRLWLPRALDLVLPLALAGVLYEEWLNELAVALLGQARMVAAVTTTLIIVMVLTSRRAVRFALTCGVCLVALAVGVFGAPAYRMHRVRTFFGVYTVNEVEEFLGKSHLLVSGTTYHGIENQMMRGFPAAYYVREGPVGQLLQVAELQAPVTRVGAIGLGVGAVACYATPSRTVTFFELDPEVERLARDERFFHFLKDCPGARVVLGDGRLTLAREPDGAFDVLILDAFSGDAVPTHLLTREALQLYLSKLTPNGKLLVHVTNTYVDLVPVLGDLASDAGLAAWSSDYDDWEQSPLAWPCTWVALARRDDELMPLQAFASKWKRVPPARGRPWTDEATDLVGALRWSPPTQH